MTALAVAGLAPGMASAQTMSSDSSAGGTGALPSATGNAAAAAGELGAGSRGGSGVGGGRAPLTIVPSVSVKQTLLRGDSATPGDTRFESVTELSPGVQISAGSRRLKGFLSYALHAVHDANESGRGGIEHSLNSVVNAEVVEGFAFLDANAAISLQPVSAAGPQYADDSLKRSNRTQVRSYSLSPYLRGTLAGRVDYEARLNHASTHTEASDTYDSQSTTGSLRFSGRTGFSAVDWSLFGTRDSLDYDAGRKTRSDRGSAELGYAVTPQLRLSARGGRESSDFVTVDKQGKTTYGYGLMWQPSNVTSLSAQWDRRVYGNTHSLIFSHRTPRTIWTYTDSRDVSTGASRNTVGSLGSAYELFYELFASQQPDPALRAALVNAFLRNNGIGASSPILSNFLTSAATSQRYQSLSAGWAGLRDTATLTLRQTNTRRIDQVAAALDDLSTADAVRQREARLELAHRLTPLSSFSLSGSLLRSRTASVGTSRFTSFEAGLSSQLGVRTSASLSARRSQWHGGNSSYGESALTGSLTLRF